MKDRAGKDARIIEDALQACAGDLQCVRDAHWRFSLANGRAFEVDARASAEWLSLSTMGQAAALDRVSLLRLNHEVEGTCRLAVDLRDQSLSLRGDIVLGEGVDVPARVFEACAGLKRLSERLHRAEVMAGDRDERGSSPETAIDDWSRALITSACRDGRWPCVERRDGTVAVELEVPDACHHALVSGGDRAPLVLAVDVVDWDEAHEDCVQAVAALLLNACRTLRFTRAAATSEAGLTARFDIAFETPPCSLEIDQALRALSMACRMCAREADVLRDPAMAKRFLAMDH